jgi:NodT family efflux transporter outer membrane factor (OMF) lipoprotein
MPSKVLLIAVLLVGCASGDSPSRADLAPKLDNPTLTTPGGTRAAAAWWRAFEDPDLNQLIAQALQRNPDLSAAAARVRESRALLIAVDADLLPRLDAQLALASQRMSNQTGQNFPGMPRRTNVGSAAVQLTWEVDLWGAVSDRAQAALADAEAAAFRAAAVEVALAAQVTRTWFAVRLAREELACLRADFTSRMTEMNLVSLRTQAGIDDDDTLSSARLAAAQAKADELDATRRLGALENALKVLIDQPVGQPLPETVHNTDGSNAPLIVKVPNFGAGIASELLLARPDLRAASRTFDATLAREGSAQADFYPRLMLVGDAGWAADPSSRIGKTGSGFWSLMPTVTLPIFEGQRNQSALEVARARAEIAAADWRKAVLNAFKEVDDALIDLRDIAQQEELAEKVLTAVKDRLKNAEVRAKAGLANGSEIEAARRDLYLARRTLAGFAWERRQAAVRLAAATGGGFTLE